MDQLQAVSEKRAFPRVDTPYTALLCTSNLACAVRVKDLSHSGAAIILPGYTGIAVGEGVILHFFSRDANTLVSRLSACIVRIFNYHGYYTLGVQFRVFNRDVDNIIRHLQNNIADS